MMLLLLGCCLLLAEISYANHLFLKTHNLLLQLLHILCENSFFFDKFVFMSFAISMV